MNLPITKDKIIQVLKTISLTKSNVSIIDYNIVRNIQVFGDELILDLELPNPTFQVKKKINDDIKKVIQEHFTDKLKIKINFSIKKNDNLKPKPKLSNIKNIIAIASGKGGVGKSTITSNIAVTLSNMGFNVGILDADIYGPSIPLMFDVENEKPLAIQIENKTKIKPIESYKIKLLSIGFFVKSSEAIIWRGPMASKALNQLIFDADWGELDFLLIDLPPGTGDIHLSIVQSLPITGAVIVTTPQPVSLTDARKGIAMFQDKSINVPIIGVIENMSYFKVDKSSTEKYYIFGEKGAEKLCSLTSVPFLGELPLIQNIREASDIGRPVVLQNNESTEIFKNMTKKMSSELLKRIKNLPPSEIVRITTMSGCEKPKQV